MAAEVATVDGVVAVSEPFGQIFAVDEPEFGIMSSEAIVPDTSDS